MENKFGKGEYRTQFKPTADIPAAQSYTFLITQALQDNYGPFTSFKFTNFSSKSVSLVLDGGFGGTGTIQATSPLTYIVPAYTAFQIEKTDGVLFYRAFVKNLNAATAIDIATTATEYIILEINNQT